MFFDPLLTPMLALALWIAVGVLVISLILDDRSDTASRMLSGRALTRFTIYLLWPYFVWKILYETSIVRRIEALERRIPELQKMAERMERRVDPDVW